MIPWAADICSYGTAHHQWWSGKAGAEPVLLYDGQQRAVRHLVMTKLGFGEPGGRRLDDVVLFVACRLSGFDLQLLEKLQISSQLQAAAVILIIRRPYLIRLGDHDTNVLLICAGY